LRHPNIFRVYDLVEDRGKAATWVKDLFAALEYAHKDVGMIHGDIRPNYLIVGPAGSIKVKDFGIANCIADSMRQLTKVPETSEALPCQSPQRRARETASITDDLYSPRQTASQEACDG